MRVLAAVVEGLGVGPELALDVGDGLVVRRQGDLSCGGAALVIGEADGDLARLARLVLGFVGLDGHVEQLGLGRHQQLAGLHVQAAFAGHGGLDEEVGHLSGGDRHVHHRRAAGQVDHAVTAHHAADQVIAEEHPRVWGGSVDQQVGGVARAVDALVGDHLEFVEAVSLALELGAVDPQHGIAHDLLLPGVTSGEADAVLAFARRGEGKVQSAVNISFRLPRTDRLLHHGGVARPLVFDAGHADRALGRHGYVGRGHRADLDEGFILRAVPAAVGLDEGVEGLASHHDRATAFDGAAAGVANLGLDHVTVVSVGLLLGGL